MDYLAGTAPFNGRTLYESPDALVEVIDRRQREFTEALQDMLIGVAHSDIPVTPLNLFLQRLAELLAEVYLESPDGLAKTVADAQAAHNDNIGEAHARSKEDGRW